MIMARWPRHTWTSIYTYLTIFLLFPFSRLVHIWSGFAALGYLFRPYQVVRSRRLNLPSGQNQPPAPRARA